MRKFSYFPIYLTAVLYCAAFIFADNANRAASENLGTTTGERCYSDGYPSNSYMGLLCFKWMKTTYTKRNVSENEVEKIAIQITDLIRSWSGPIEGAAKLARFYCAITLNVCITKKANLEKNNDTIQIVPPCRSLCKTAKKTYMSGKCWSRKK